MEGCEDPEEVAAVLSIEVNEEGAAVPERQLGVNGTTPHGRGIMRYANNDTYEGQWVNGLRQGKGQQTNADGSVYQGDFRADSQTGQGTLSSAQGDSYTGSFQDGEYHGPGELTYENGDIFRGTFVYGSREGAGSLYSARDKSELTGTWEQDELRGAGQVRNMQIESLNTILSHSNNAVLSKATMSATGRQNVAAQISTESIGSRTAISKGLYSGPVIDGLPSGETGVCVYADGSEYNGAWRNGRRNGLGTYIFPNLDEFRGKWVGDKRSGFGTLTSAINPSYEGLWDDNLPHGQGMLALKDGKVYTGNFVSGRRTGEGKLCLGESESVIFEGMWANDSPVKSVAGR